MNKAERVEKKAEDEKKLLNALQTVVACDSDYKAITGIIDNEQPEKRLYRALVCLGSSKMAEAVMFSYGLIDNTSHDNTETAFYLAELSGQNVSNSTVWHLQNTMCYTICTYLQRYYPEYYLGLKINTYNVFPKNKSRAEKNIEYLRQRNLLLSIPILPEMFSMYGNDASDLFAKYYRLGKYAYEFDNVIERAGIPISETNERMLDTQRFTVQDGRQLANKLLGEEVAWIDVKGKVAKPPTKRDFEYRFAEYQQHIQIAEKIRAHISDKLDTLTPLQLHFLQFVFQHVCWGYSVTEALKHFNERISEHYMGNKDLNYYIDSLNPLVRALLAEEIPEINHLDELEIARRAKMILASETMQVEFIDTLRNIFIAHYGQDIGISLTKTQSLNSISNFLFENLRRLTVRVINGTVWRNPTVLELFDFNERISPKHQNTIWRSFVPLFTSIGNLNYVEKVMDEYGKPIYEAEVIALRQYLLTLELDNKDFVLF